MSLVDIALYQPSDSTWTAGLAIPGNSGRQITGMEKLVQRFLLELLTDIGSLQFDAKRGSNFLSNLYNTNIYSERDVFDIFNLAMLTVTLNLQSEEAKTDPNDERFSTALLTNVTITPGILSLNLVVYDLNGNFGSVSLPLSISSQPDISTLPVT